MSARNNKAKKSDFKMPKWMDCAWRRDACNKLSCKLCGRILRQRQSHIDRGEDPDDLTRVFEDVGNSLKEAMQMVKKDAERLGINITNIEKIQEPPEPYKFSLYRKVNAWRKKVMNLASEAEQGHAWWLQTEAAEDLLWYANTITAKTYRQLCNKWHLKLGDEYGEVDYQYTNYVLKNCLILLRNSLKELSSCHTAQGVGLMTLAEQFQKLEKPILKI